ncbi:MAG: dihydroorotate dehydrogenase [Bacteroidales bacterium]|nr:dihydroorotate dehydrogenase [Bacteroidales bacterium]
MVDLSVDFNGLSLKNPVLTASGTFGFGLEYADFVDLEKLGGFIVKGTTLHHREGNAYPRMAEVTAGMLNAVGLQNKGVDYFCQNTYPQLKDLKTNVLVNVSGSCVDDYVATAAKINELENIPGIELNISCPNVKEGGMAFGTNPNSAAEVVAAVRKAYKRHLMVKLSPNVTDIVSIAQAVEAAGADSVSLVNTFLGMAIDVHTRRPKLSTITGGMSGPAIKPIAVRMVWQVAHNVKIPVCGLGGIMNAEDAIEFLLAGASCVQIGTANFIYPDTTIRVVNGIYDYCEKYGVKNISELIGGMK